MYTISLISRWITVITIIICSIENGVEGAEPRPVFVEVEKQPTIHSLPLIYELDTPISDASGKIEKILRPPLAFSYNQAQDQTPDGTMVEYFGQKRYEDAPNGRVRAEGNADSADSQSQPQKNEYREKQAYSYAMEDNTRAQRRRAAQEAALEQQQQHQPQSDDYLERSASAAHQQAVVHVPANHRPHHKDELEEAQQAESVVVEHKGGKGEEDAQSAASDHHKGHDHKHHPKEHHKEHEKGGGKEHHSDHHGEHGEKGKKGYDGHHKYEKVQKGHHDKEGHHGRFKDHGGHHKEHHEEEGHFGEHHKGAKGEKGSKYDEEGEHHKGHSTHGEHNVHKKDEFEKRHEFYDESHEGGDHEKHGGFDHEHHYKKGGHKKHHHKKGGHHEEGHGKKGHHDKGHHHHDDKGHKHDKGHHKHHHHHHEDGEDKGHHHGHKWHHKKDNGGGDHHDKHHHKHHDGHGSHSEPTKQVVKGDQKHASLVHSPVVAVPAPKIHDGHVAGSQNHHHRHLYRNGIQDTGIASPVTKGHVVGFYEAPVEILVDNGDIVPPPPPKPSPAKPRPTKITKPHSYITGRAQPQLAQPTVYIPSTQITPKDMKFKAQKVSIVESRPTPELSVEELIQRKLKERSERGQLGDYGPYNNDARRKKTEKLLNDDHASAQSKKVQIIVEDADVDSIANANYPIAFKQAKYRVKESGNVGAGGGFPPGEPGIVGAIPKGDGYGKIC